MNLPSAPKTYLLVKFLICTVVVFSWHAVAQTNVTPNRATTPDEENAALLFQKAEASLNLQLTESEKKLLLELEELKGNEPLPPGASNLLARIVDGNASIMPQFRKASTASRSQYPVDWSNGAYTPMPHLPMTALPSSFLHMCSLRYTIAGKEAEAIDAWLLGVAVARTLEAEPNLQSQAFRIVRLKEAIESLQRIINGVALSADSLEKIKQPLEMLERQESENELFARALRFEKDLISRSFEMPVAQQAVLAEEWERWRYTNSSSEPEGEHSLQNALRSHTEEDRAFATATYNELLRLWSAPYPTRLKAIAYARTRGHEAARKKELLTSNLMLGGTGFTLPKEAQGLALLRLARIAIALEQYRLDHHKLYPPFLSHLVPKYLDRVPLDPIDGKPLRYRKLGRGYQAWSIGDAYLGSSTPRFETASFVVVSPP